jgi:hypothetical protein
MATCWRLNRRLDPGFGEVQRERQVVVIAVEIMLDLLIQWVCDDNGAGMDVLMRDPGKKRGDQRVTLRPRHRTGEPLAIDLDRDL